MEYRSTIKWLYWTLRIDNGGTTTKVIKIINTITNNNKGYNESGNGVMASKWSICRFVWSESNITDSSGKWIFVLVITAGSQASHWVTNSEALRPTIFSSLVNDGPLP
jgi:hypothetical protein